MLRIVAALVTLAVYGRTLSHTLLWWDDRKNICANPYFQKSFGAMLQGLWTEPFFGLYVPATYTLWSLFANIGSLTLSDDCLDWAPLFHGLSLALHLLNGFLLYRLLRGLAPLGDDRLRLLAVAIFWLHPVQVETVAWVSATRDLLAASCGLGALLVYRGDRPWWSLPLFALSLLAKPVGVVFPVLALLMPGRKRWSVLAPALLGAVMLSSITKMLQNDSLLTFAPEIWERPLIALHSIGFYTASIIWPWPLVPAYARSVPQLLADPTLYWIMIATSLPLALAWFMPAARRPLLWMLVALGPVLGLVSFGFQEISTVADRFMYIPMMGLAWMIARQQGRRLAQIFAVLAVGCACLTAVQVGIWEDDEALFKRVIEVNDSPIAHGNLANVYFHAGRYREAEPEFRQALKGNARLFDAWLGLARTLESTGRADEGLEVYREAIAKGVAAPQIFNNLASMLYERGRDGAEEMWRRAASLDPFYMEPRYNLGQMYLNRGQKDLARKYFTEALAIAPRDGRVQERLKSLELAPLNSDKIQ